MKHNVVIHMGAADWSARVRVQEKFHPDTWAVFNFRTMERKERSTFHRELMNAFRASRTPQRAAA